MNVFQRVPEVTIVTETGEMKRIFEGYMTNTYVQVFHWLEVPTLKEEMAIQKCHNMEIDEAISRNMAQRARDRELKSKY